MRSFVMAAVVALACFPAAHAADAPKPTNRAEATDVVRGLRRIVTPNGIDRAEAVTIGGIKQIPTPEQRAAAEAIKEQLKEARAKAAAAKAEKAKAAEKAP